MTKERIINGCEFQNGCIEYKDISYLKVMPICAIYELSRACHDKENKCKYYQVYKQLKHLQEENEGLKSLNDFNVQKIEVLQEENEQLKKLKKYYKGFVANCRYCDEWYMDKCNYIKKDKKYKQALEEIRNEIGDLKNINRLINLQKILDTINEVLNDN